MIHARFDEMMAEGAAELADLASRRTQLEGEQQKLRQAHYAGAIPLDLLKREQDRITASLETIEYRITAHHGHHADAPAAVNQHDQGHTLQGTHHAHRRRRGGAKQQVVQGEQQRTRHLHDQDRLAPAQQRPGHGGTEGHEAGNIGRVQHGSGRRQDRKDGHARLRADSRAGHRRHLDGGGA